MKVFAGKDIVTRRRVLHLCVQWQPRDLWIGLYVENWHPFRGYLILVPCVPLHIKHEPKEARRLKIV